MSDYLSWKYGDKVEKIKGYYAVGYIVSVFPTMNGETRVVFEFADYPGMLHIFRPDQLYKR